jgi:hypothetical protein
MSGQEFTFTIRRGVGTADCVSVNYDDFVNDVEVGDMLLVDGMLYLSSLVNKEVSIIWTVLIDWKDLLRGDNSLFYSWFKLNFVKYLDITYFSEGMVLMTVKKLGL